MTASTKSAVSKRRIDNSWAIRPRWLFWVFFWYLLAAGMCLHSGLIMFTASFLAVPNRQTIFRSLLRFHRRIFHQPPGPVRRKFLLIAPVVICFGVMLFTVAWCIFTYFVRLPDLSFSMTGIVILGLIALPIMIYFYNADRNQTE